MRVYLSGPMRGIPDFNFPKFDRVAAKLREFGFTVFSPADNDRNMTLAGIEITARECFEQDTRWICRYAEGMVMMDGWRDSRGARVEKALAEALDLPLFYWDDRLGDVFIQDHAEVAA